MGRAWGGSIHSCPAVPRHCWGTATMAERDSRKETVVHLPTECFPRPPASPPGDFRGLGVFADWVLPQVARVGCRGVVDGGGLCHTAPGAPFNQPRMPPPHRPPRTSRAGPHFEAGGGQQAQGPAALVEPAREGGALRVLGVERLAPDAARAKGCVVGEGLAGASKAHHDDAYHVLFCGSLKMSSALSILGPFMLLCAISGHFIFTSGPFKVILGQFHLAVQEIMIFVVNSVSILRPNRIKASKIQ